MSRENMDAYCTPGGLLRHGQEINYTDWSGQKFKGLVIGTGLYDVVFVAALDEGKTSFGDIEKSPPEKLAFNCANIQPVALANIKELEPKSEMRE